MLFEELMLMLRYFPARLDLHESGIILKPFKRTSTAICFKYFILILNIWEDFKVLSRFMQKWVQPSACLDHNLHRILSSYWLAHFHLILKSAKVHLCFGLDCGIMNASRNPKNNWCISRIFGARFGKKDHGLSTCNPWSEQTGGLEAFLHGAAQNFELLSNIQDQKLKIKNI